MSMIFPGMDPYLENPQRWTGFHAALIVYIRDQLRPLLHPRYVAAVEDRVFVEGPDREIRPDVWVERAERPAGRAATAVAEVETPLIVKAPGPEVHESYIEILDLASGQKVVTVIEVLSPTNKFPGPGRDSYLEKQHEVLWSTAHLVEIDLLRVGPHVLAVPQWLAAAQGPYDYLVCVNRAARPRQQYELYPRRLREPLPRFGIPLANGDPDVPLDLQAAIAQTYDCGDYRYRINYSRPCEPPLMPEDQEWAIALVRQQGDA
jgi:hypothetical protein